MTSNYSKGSEKSAGVELVALRHELNSAATDVEEVRQRVRAITDKLRALALENTRDESLKEMYLQALAINSVDSLTHPDVSMVTRSYELDCIPHSDSFWRSIVARRRKKQLGFVPEKYLGIRKDDDERFASLADVRTPNTVFTGAFSEALTEKRPAVLKPVVSSDSRGAFYLFRDTIYSISKSSFLAGLDDLERSARLEVGDVAVDSGEWQVQDMVTYGDEPATDLKFYCFYGRIGTVLEVSRYPALNYAYFDEHLKPISFRLDERSTSFQAHPSVIPGLGVSDSHLADVARLSLSIPVPFMRIDFLNSDEGLVFCEFSSAPGMSHSLSPDHNRRLGRMYHEAEMRLVGDLLAGKKFSVYHEFMDGRIPSSAGVRNAW